MVNIAKFLSLFLRALPALMLFFICSVTPESFAVSGETLFQNDTLHNSSNDSLLPHDNHPPRWDDPNIDTRFDRGTLQPWHDTRSIYLRRTVPISNLAFIRRDSNDDV